MTHPQEPVHYAGSLGHATPPQAPSTIDALAAELDRIISEPSIVRPAAIPTLPVPVDPGVSPPVLQPPSVPPIFDIGGGGAPPSLAAQPTVVPSASPQRKVSRFSVSKVPQEQTTEVRN